MQELVLIGAVALIVFGPRKLPQMAKTAGKMMSEFRKATSDFKETWEKEVEFDEFRAENEMKNISSTSNTIANNTALPAQADAPEIKEIRQEDLEKHFPTHAVSAVETDETNSQTPPKVPSGKQDWL